MALGQAALFCFERSVDFLPNHLTLLIENGALLYNLHGFLSRALKKVCLYTFKSKKRFKMILFQKIVMKMDNVNELKSKKETMLVLARKIFETCLSVLSDAPEHNTKDAWLIHYMLGKINEKNSCAPSKILSHYHRAAFHLNEEGARYPIKFTAQISK